MKQQKQHNHKIINDDVKIISNIKTRLIVIFELARYVCVSFGFFLSYQPNVTATEILNTLLLLVVIPLAGLTGLEAIFIGAASAKAKKREIGSTYQTQSGLNNLSTAITAWLVWYLQWGKQASLTVLFVLLTFLILSSMVHTYEYFIKKNKQLIHLIRPLLTTGLILACIPLIIRTLSS